MVAMCTHMVTTPSVLNTGGAMRSLGRRAERQFRNLRYVNGCLCRGSVGLQPLGNPSDRAEPLGIYYYLCRHMREFRLLSVAIADHLEGAGSILSVSAIVGVMKAHGFGRYSGRLNYTNVRFARSIVLADGRRHADTAEDWRVLRSMSLHVRRRVKRWAIWDHATAISFRDAMREIVGQPRYSLLDLILYTCLIRESRP